MPNSITNYGTEDCGTLTLGFKAWQSPDGGLGLEREVCPTLSATPSALEPTVCHPVVSLHRPAARVLNPKRSPREIWIGQIGTTERLGNNFWREFSFTLQTAGGDATPTIIDRRRP